MHSNLSKGERYNNRQRIANEESSIIIGSRSALFMPFKNLKLIIVDEEYDSSYKQTETPRYNGRDVAKVMAVIYNCPIVLGAATPSVTTFLRLKIRRLNCWKCGNVFIEHHCLKYMFMICGAKQI